MKIPRVSIVMPVFNSGKFVAESIRSLLDQTYRDFELIIVDDGSTDSSKEIIAGFTDPRIRVLTNDKNQGIVFSRNKGLAQVRGEYYAPFDSDDIASQDKLEKQVKYMDAHPEIAMIGSWAKMMDESDKTLNQRWKLTSKPELIPSIMLFRNYFVHSSLLVRMKAIENINYEPGLDVVEDYKFCADLAFSHPVSIFPDYLLKYRVHSKSAMRINNRRLLEQDTRIYRYLFWKLGIKLSETDLNCIFALKGNNKIDDFNLLLQIHQFLLNILNQNLMHNFFDHHYLQKTVADRWLKACFLGKHLHVKMIAKLVSSPLTRLLLKA